MQGLQLCPSLEQLDLVGAESITALSSHQLAVGYFSKLEQIEKLQIGNCPSMEEVMTEEELEEEMTNEFLFPRLEELELSKLPNLRHFFLTNFHFLEKWRLKAVQKRRYLF